MHLRIKVSLIAGLIGVLFLGYLTPLLPGSDGRVSVARADTLPTDILSWVKAQDAATLVSGIDSAQQTNEIVDNFTQIMVGSADYDSKYSARPAREKYLVGRVIAGDILGTSKTYLLDSNDPTNTYSHVYDRLFHVNNLDTFNSAGQSMVDQIDEDWTSALNATTGLDALYSTTDPSGVAQPMATNLQNLIEKKILPEITVLYAGRLLMQVMHDSPTFNTSDNTLTREVFCKVASCATFDEMTQDLNQRYGYIYKQPKFSGVLAGTQGLGPKDKSSSYNNIAAIYNDVIAADQIFHNVPPSTVTDSAHLTSLKTEIKTFAGKMDSATAVDSTNGKSRFLRCGSSTNGLSLQSTGEAITAAICSLVILVQDFAISTLQASMDLLGQVSGVPGVGTTGGSQTFLTSLIPTQFKEDFLVKALGSAAGADPKDPAVNFGQTLRHAHAIVLTTLNALIFLLFIMIAMANILQIQVGTYSVNKLLAPIIIGFLLATGSWFICRATIEVGTVAASAIMSRLDLLTTNNSTGCPAISDAKGIATKPTTGSAAAGNFVCIAAQIGSVGGKDTTPLTDDVSTSQPSFSKVFQQGILNLFTLAAAVVIFILAFMFMIRVLFMAFLIPLSPIGFFTVVIPPFKKIWTRWSGPFFQWLFMPVFATFWIWLGFVWLASQSTTGGVGTINSLIAYLFGMICFTAAIKTSAGSLTGEAAQALGKWNNMGKSLWKNTGAAAGKAGFAVAKDRLGTFAISRNLGWNQTFKAIKEGVDERAKANRELANKKFAARDKGLGGTINRRRYYRREKAALKGRGLDSAAKKIQEGVRKEDASDLQDRELEVMGMEQDVSDMKAKNDSLVKLRDAERTLGDEEHKDTQALIEALGHATHEAEGLAKKQIESKSLSHGLANLTTEENAKMSLAHENKRKYEANKIVESKKTAVLQSDEEKAFIAFVDEANNGFLEYAKDSKGNIIKDKNGKEIIIGNKVYNALAEVPKLEKAVQKLRGKQVRAQEVNDNIIEGKRDVVMKRLEARQYDVDKITAPELELIKQNVNALASHAASYEAEDIKKYWQGFQEVLDSGDKTKLKTYLDKNNAQGYHQMITKGAAIEKQYGDKVRAEVKKANRIFRQELDLDKANKDMWQEGGIDRYKSKVDKAVQFIQNKQYVHGANDTQAEKDKKTKEYEESLEVLRDHARIVAGLGSDQRAYEANGDRSKHFETQYAHMAMIKNLIDAGGSAEDKGKNAELLQAINVFVQHQRETGADKTDVVAALAGEAVDNSNATINAVYYSSKYHGQIASIDGFQEFLQKKLDLGEQVTMADLQEFESKVTNLTQKKTIKELKQLSNAMAVMNLSGTQTGRDELNMMQQLTDGKGKVVIGGRSDTENAELTNDVFYQSTNDTRRLAAKSRAEELKTKQAEADYRAKLTSSRPAAGTPEEADFERELKELMDKVTEQRNRQIEADREWNAVASLIAKPAPRVDKDDGKNKKKKKGSNDPDEEVIIEEEEAANDDQSDGGTP